MRSDGLHCSLIYPESVEAAIYPTLPIQQDGNIPTRNFLTKLTQVEVPSCWKIIISLICGKESINKRR